MLKEKMRDKKKLGIIIAVLLCIIILIVILINLFSNGDIVGNIQGPDGTKFKNEYEELNGKESEEGKTYPKVNISSNNVIKYSNISEILNIFNNGEDAVIYFGYSTCLYCRSAIQVLCDTAASTEIDTIYYLDVEENDNGELLKILGDKFTTEDNNVYAPLVLFVVNGNVVSYNKGTLFSQDDPYQELDASQIQGLSEIYRYGINDVLDSMKINNG